MKQLIKKQCTDLTFLKRAEAELAAEQLNLKQSEMLASLGSKINQKKKKVNK